MDSGIWPHKLVVRRYRLQKGNLEFNKMANFMDPTNLMVVSRLINLKKTWMKRVISIPK